MNLSALSDSELMASLLAVCADSRRLLAQLLVHLNEIEERRLELRAAYPSMYEFCTRRLGMSDGEACRRITAARLVRRFPSLVARVESGALNLTALCLLRDQFSESNVEVVADAASGKSKREVEELVARLAPKPDVETTISELPTPARVIPGLVLQPSVESASSKIAPLSEERYEIRFTADRALRDKIERAQDLLRHRHPNGDLNAVMHRAFDVLLGELEKERLAKSSRPQRNPKPTTTGEIPAAVRREVFERDGEQCTFVSEDGHRCESRSFLELDHIEERALGGTATAKNLRVVCRAHNRLHAERTFGKSHIESKIRERQESRDRLEQARSGLLNLGFRKDEVANTLTTLTNRHASLPPIADLLREALSILT